MIVLGADLSYTRTGLVCLDEQYHVVDYATQAIKPGPKRFLRALRWFTVNLRPKPDFVVIEDNAYGAPSRVVVTKLSALNTLFKVACEFEDIDYVEVSPSLIKKWVTGKGTAEKHVVAQELKRSFGIEFDDDKGYDLSDAAALAAWGVNHYGKRSHSQIST